MAEENKNNKEWNFSRMGKQTNINFLKSLNFPKSKKKGATCEDIVLYITSEGVSGGLITNFVVRYDPVAHQGIIMNGPELKSTGDIAMWENKFYNIVDGPNGGIDEYEVNYIANTYSFVGNIPGPIGVWMNSHSYNMKDATTLVAHHDESIVHWDISSGTAVPSPPINIGVLAMGDLINTSQGFIVAYSAGTSTNPPSTSNGIAHYDFAGNLINFVTAPPPNLPWGIISAGMFKEHSTGNIFLDGSVVNPLSNQIEQGLHQLHYMGGTMSLGPQIHSQPYPPISHPSWPTYTGAFNWQGASSHCFDIPEPACIDPTALNYDSIATTDCLGNVGGNNYSCCEYPCHHPHGWEPGVPAVIIPTWDCVNGSCVDPGTGQGQYSSLTACQTNCIVATPSWDCVNGVCIDPGTGNGQYSLMNDCQVNCIAPSWDCINGVCVNPGTGNGQYSSLTICQNLCTIPPPSSCWTHGAVNVIYPHNAAVGVGIDPVPQHTVHGASITAYVGTTAWNPSLGYNTSIGTDLPYTLVLSNASGTLPVTSAWQTGTHAYVTILGFAGTVTWGNLMPGAYTLTLTDNNGCSTSYTNPIITVPVPVPSPPP